MYLINARTEYRYERGRYKKWNAMGICQKKLLHLSSKHHIVEKPHLLIQLQHPETPNLSDDPEIDFKEEMGIGNILGVQT